MACLCRAVDFRTSGEDGGLFVSVTRGTTSHGEAEMAKVSDYGIFDFGYAK